MSMSNKRTVLLVISGAYEAEKKFLSKCGREPGGNWLYASTNGSDFAIDRFVFESRFVLINPQPGQGTDLPFSEVLSAVEVMKAQSQCIGWFHRKETLDWQVIGKELAGVIGWIAFSHDGEPIEDFMTTVGQEERDFEEIFSVILATSLCRLGNEYLAALLILCQGYLVANLNRFSVETIGSDLADLEMAARNVTAKSTNNAWWDTVFSRDECIRGDFTKTAVYEQLRKFGDSQAEDSRIQALFKKVKERSVDPDSVLEVYTFLTTEVFSRLEHHALR